MKISVIVPVYNVEQYLEQCLDSIVNQTYLELEIILVNDGSTDQSAKICRRFASQDHRIKIINQINGGVSSARNSGIREATGDYISFVDSDDWLGNETYKKMIEVAKNNQNIGVIMCDFVNVKNNVSEKISANIRRGFYNKMDIVKEVYPTLLVTEDLGRLPIVSACTCLFKKELLVHNEIKFDVSLRYAEDYLFMADVMVHANSFYYLKGLFLYNYRQYEFSRSKKYQSEWWDNFLYLNKKLNDLLFDNKDYDFSRQIKLQLIHSVLFLCSAILQNDKISTKEKLIFLRKLFNSQILKSTFSNLDFNKQSFGLKIVLYLLKYKMVKSYWVYTNVFLELNNKRKKLYDTI